MKTKQKIEELAKLDFNKTSKELLNQSIYNEFHSTSTEESALELVVLAKKLELPCYDEILNIYLEEDYLPWR